MMLNQGQADAVSFTKINCNLSRPFSQKSFDHYVYLDLNGNDRLTSTAISI